MTVSGTTHVAFDELRDTFGGLFVEHQEIGASFAVAVNGELVVDLWGGMRDSEKTLPWERDTVANIWSTTKGIAATCVALLVSRGLCAYEDAVATYWPEFGAEGKSGITVAQLLSHQAGLAGFRRPLTVEDLYDGGARAAELAAMAPWWRPGQGAGYHAITVGFLVDELCRRIDGRSIRDIIAEEIAGPGHLNISLGLPVEKSGPVATMYTTGAAQNGAPPVLDAVQQAALANPVLDPEIPNSANWRAASIASANGFADARSLALLYSDLAYAGGGEAPQSANFLSIAAPVRQHMRSVQCAGEDRVLGVLARWGCGFLINSLGLYGPNPVAFGHSGWGGSFAFGDPERGLGCAYVMNRMGNDLVGDPRAQALVGALYRALQAAA